MENKPKRGSLLVVNSMYTFTAEQRKTLGPEEQAGLIKAFQGYDKNGDSKISADELKNCLIGLGQRKITDQMVANMIKENDTSQDGFIQWGEFLVMVIKGKGDIDKIRKFGSITHQGTFKLENEHGGQHQYSNEECTSFSSLINHLLADDEDAQMRLPIDTSDPQAIFHAFDNGVLMCKLLLHIEPDCLDSRAINKHAQMNTFQIKENLQMGIAACKGIGIKMIGVGTSDFINHVPHLALTFIWQALRLATVSNISLKNTPEIIRLAEEGEDMKHLNKLKAEQILIRWVNFHLKKAGQERRITNLKDDLRDSVALLYVLNQLDKKSCPIEEAFDEEDFEDRAQYMLDNAKALGVPNIMEPEDFVQCNVKINTLFVASIFNTKHGLEEMTAEELNSIGILDDDIEGSREERVFRLWINSLNLEGVHVEDLIDEIGDGVLLCKIVHKLNDKVIDWKKVELKPKNDFGKNGNCGQAIAGCKAMGLKMIGVGGHDIVKGTRKDIIATCWSLCKMHYLQLIGGKTEKELVEWANSQVKDSSLHIKDLKDKQQLSNGKFLIEVCRSIEPRYINDELITKGESEEDACLNAKYGITLARKMEAVVFCVWEDLVKCNPKQNLIIYATLFETAENYFPPAGN